MRGNRTLQHSRFLHALVERCAALLAVMQYIYLRLTVSRPRLSGILPLMEYAYVVDLASAAVLCYRIIL